MGPAAGMIPVPIPRPIPAAGGGAAGLTGGDVVRIIRQRLVLIIFLWLFFSVITAVGTWLMVRYYPKFTATAYIRVQSIAPVNPLDPLAAKEVREEEIQRLLQDQVLVVKSPDVLLRVLTDPDIRATTWFSEAEAERVRTNEDPMDLLADIIRADPIPDSNYIAVSASWKMPTEVAKLVNQTVQKYMELVEKQQKERIRKAFDQLSEELSMAKRLLDGKQAEIDAFRQSEAAMGTARDEIKERLLTLTALQTEIQLDVLGKKTIYEQLEKVKPEDLPITPDLQALLNSDPRIMSLDQRYQQTEEELNSAKSRFGPNHRVVKQLQAARDAAADRVAEERVRKTMQYQSDQIDQAKRNYLDAQSQLLAIGERVQEARSEQQDMDQKYASYERKQEEATQLKQQYEQLLEQQNVVNMTLRMPETVQISVQSKAIEPRRRSSPKYEIWIPAGTLLGLAISIGFALLLELADKSVRTPRDVQRQSIPVLATIPNTDDDEIEITRVETASLDAPHSITAESFRTLRANLFFSAPAEQQGAILVTSPSAQNGKTTVATNLAIAIALSGRRVLLIDANFRRPSLPRIFPDMRDEGLSNILIGQAHLDDVIMASSVPGLDVLSTGPAPPNPAELLGSAYLRDMIVDARARYDQVIFDGPPVLLISDAMVLAGAVDGVLLVCQYRATSRGALQRTHIQLEGMNARIFGAVLNKVETRAGGYFRKAYREFYAYSEHRADEEAGEPKKLKKGDGADQIAEQASGGEGAESEGGVAVLTADEDAAVRSDDDRSAPDSGDEVTAVDLDEAIESLGGEKIIGEGEFDLGENLTGDERDDRSDGSAPTA